MDQAIGKEVLRVVEPAAIEASVQSEQNRSHEHDAALQALENDLQAAQYAAQRAQKQYDAADPENRLVADELERRWNQALERVQELESRVAQHRGSRLEGTSTTPNEFADLADELETVWNDENSDARLKKRIVRTLIREVIAGIDPETGNIHLVIHWHGGVHTELQVPRRRRGVAGSTSADIVEAVGILCRVSTDATIAGLSLIHI